MNMLRNLIGASAVFLTSLSPALAQIEIQEITSPGGITAWLYEDHSIPMIGLEANFRGGASLDAPDKQGATTLMSALLEEGTGNMDAVAFATAAEGMGALFTFDTSQDSVHISAQVLTEFRDDSFALLRAAIVEPNFDEVAVERVRGQLLSNIRSRETDPTEIAHLALNKIMFDGHAYARHSDGTEASITALTREDLATAHENALVRDRLNVSVVGDITAADLAPLLDALFGDLPRSGSALPAKTDPNTPGSLTVIDLPIPQSVVVFGHEGISRDDPDFIPAYIMNHILGGGGFGSRLTEEVREERGLTYGIYTFLAPGDLGWSYMGQFSSANEVVAEAIEITRAEWARMAEEGVTEPELEAAKKYLTGAYPLRFNGNAAIANQLVGLKVADLGLDYVNARNDLVNAVTVEDINRVAKRLLHPDHLTWVVVGRPEGVETTK